MAFALPARAGDFWCRHKIFWHPPMAGSAVASALAHLPMMHGEGQVPMLMSF